MPTRLQVACLNAVLAASWIAFPAQALPQAASPQAQKAGCGDYRGESAPLLAEHRYAVAADLLQQQLPACADQQAFLLLLAQTQMLAQRLEPARNTIDRLLAKDPTHAEALVVKGKILYLNNQDAMALTSFEAAVAGSPQAAEPHYWLGRLHYADHDTQAAMAEMQEALALDPNFYRAYDGLALCFENLGDTRRTVDTYMKGIALVYTAFPHYDTLYADFAEYLLRYHQSAKALSLATEAADRNPHEPRNFFLAGKAARDAGKMEVSVRWLTRAAQLNPAYPDPHCILAQIYRKTGNAAGSANQSTQCRTLTEQAPHVQR